MFRKMFAPLFMLCCWFCTGCATNPVTGEKQLMFFPQHQDEAIGQKYAPEVEKQMGGRINSTVVQNYIYSVGQNIAAVSHKPYLQYHFVALQDQSTNAFALPGGYIFITMGMLEKLESEAQLAAILAHETVHVVARHSSEIMSQQIGIELLLSAVTSEETPRAVLTAADLTRQIFSLKYSRKQEREADLAGIDYLVKAGYKPYAMVETMQMLRSQHSARPIEFLSSHPAPESRIDYLTDKIQTQYYGLAGLKSGKEDYRKYVLDQLN